MFKKKFLSLFLAIIMLFSICSIPTEAISLTTIDPETINAIYIAEENEKIINSWISYPIVVIITEKNNEVLANTSYDYGKTWTPTVLNEIVPGFKANGVFIADTFFLTEIYIYGSDENGKISIISSSTGENYQEDPGPYKDVSGEVVEMGFDGINYLIYLKQGKDYYLIKTHYYAINAPLQKIDKVPTNLVFNYDHFYYFDDENLYVSQDGINWTTKSIFALTHDRKAKIIDYRYDDEVCTDTEILVTYLDSDNNQKYLGLDVEVDEDGNTSILESVKSHVSIDFKKFGTNVKLTGSWGWPLLISNEKVASLVQLKKDAVAPVCYRKDTSWINQKTTPSDWALWEVETAAEKGILTPRTIPENLYTDSITRELFCEYIYNLVKQHYKGELTRTNVFTDTTNESINVLAHLGIINGVGDNRFEPDRNITRQEAAKVLANTIKLLNPNINTNAPKATYKDYDKVHDWAKSSVDFVSFAEVFKGDDLGNFNPTGNLTIEAGIITVLRILNNVNGQGTNHGCSVC